MALLQMNCKLKGPLMKVAALGREHTLCTRRTLYVRCRAIADRQKHTDSYVIDYNEFMFKRHRCLRPNDGPRLHPLGGDRNARPFREAE